MKWIFIYILFCLNDAILSEQFVLINQSPVVGTTRSTSFVCTDLSQPTSRALLLIRRSFAWRGKLSSRATTRNVLNRTGLRFSWKIDLNNSVGAFSCGSSPNKVTSFKMRNNGNLRAESFSKVTTIGAKVVIRMLPIRTPSKDILKRVDWWKDGRKLNIANGRIWQAEAGGRTLVISNISMNDAGVYMAHHHDQSVDMAAATILIVHPCRSNMWSSNCSMHCMVCNNGGLCSPTTGKCICPHGFTGKHCERPCPHHTFGPSCSTRCSDLTGRDTCSGLQMCQITGCLCANGWKGPNCDERCPQGRYGASCSEVCACRNNGTCDSQHGCVCTHGWFGPSCKSKGFGGEVVTDQSISITTPSFEIPPRIVNITAIPSFLVNRDQDVMIRCSVTGIPRPGHGEVILKRLDKTIIYPQRTSMSSSETTSVFIVTVSASYPGPFFCVATTRAGTTSGGFNFTIPVLPKPINAPFLISKTSSRLLIGLNSVRYLGDGPIVQREILYKRHNETSFNSLSHRSIHNDSIMIGRLTPYTLYDVRVLLYRPGGRTGMGPPGPIASMRTDCAMPTSGPTILLTYATNDTILYISWENPKLEEIKGNVLGYTIVYQRLGVVSSRRRMVEITYGSTTSVTLKKMTPLAVYGIKMSLYNCAGTSPFSKEARVTMGRLEKPTGPKITVTNRTSHSINIHWNVPSNAQPYTIMTYEFVFNEAGDNSPNAIRLHKNTTSRDKLFDELIPYTSYTFCVRAFNHEGAGNYSGVIRVNTLEDAPTAPVDIEAYDVKFDEVNLKWNPPIHPNGILRNYDVEMAKGVEQWLSIMQNKRTNETTLQIVNLQDYTQYRFRLRGKTIKSGLWSDVIIVRTMSTKPLQPPQITNIDVTSPQSVIVAWQAPPDSVYVGNITFYKVIYTDDIRQNDEHWRSKMILGNDRRQKIEGLRADTVYFFKIAAQTVKMGKYSEEFTTRTDRLGLPPPPFRARVANVTSSSAIITWMIHSGYRITIVKVRYLSLGPTMPNLIVEAGKENTILTSLSPETQYKVELISNNYMGDSSGNPVVTFITSSKGGIDFEDIHLPFLETIEFKIVIAVIGGLVMIVITMTIIAYCRCQSESERSSCPSNVEMDSVSTYLRASTFGSLSQGGAINSRSGTLLSCHSGNSRTTSTYSTQILDESLIISWESIIFEEVPLGVGNFGQVVKAVVQKDKKVIQTAVKMLKDGSTLDDKRDFLAELDTMVRIGYHRNVITLVGACEHDNSMYICTEFAPDGNLLQFLRKSRRLEDEQGTYTSLSQNQLVKFAHDVAEGMAYLSEKQIIHRDLAARNVLLGEGHVCKVADFGLARGEGVYVKKTASRLPIRWMAIESLNYNVYTTKSDVWSFGVLLWEIVGLGGTPYCGMSCAELYDKLPTGYRMEKPLNCDDEVYALMSQCWKDRPYDRPTFSQLCVALERMSDARCCRNYVNTAIFDDFQFTNIDVTEEEEEEG